MEGCRHWMEKLKNISTGKKPTSINTCPSFKKVWLSLNQVKIKRTYNLVIIH